MDRPDDANLGVRPTIRLRVAEPDVFGDRLARELGLARSAATATLALANAVLVVEESSVNGAAVEVAAIDAAAALYRPRVDAPAPSILALGWATIDLERAAEELSATVRAASGPRPAPGSGAGHDLTLGARLRAIGRPLDSPFDIVLLEPVTEGPLAAALARRGEGLSVVYVGVSRLGAVTTGSGPVDRTGTSRAPDPPGRYIAGSRFGPWVVVLGETSARFDGVPSSA